jgi:hypothetical protein
VLFYAAVAEFAFVVIERGMTVLVKCGNEGFLMSVNRCEDSSLKRLILHVTKGVALLDSGSSMTYLRVVLHHLKVPWYSTVLK